MVGCPLSAKVGHHFFVNGCSESGPDPDGDTTYPITGNAHANGQLSDGKLEVHLCALQHCTGSLLSPASTWLTTGKHCLFFPVSGPSFGLAGQVLATLTTMVPFLLPQTVQSRSFAIDQGLFKSQLRPFCSTLSSA